MPKIASLFDLSGIAALLRERGIVEENKKNGNDTDRPHHLKVMDACAWIFKDEKALANRELIDFACLIEVFDLEEKKKYYEILAETGGLSNEAKLDVYILNQKLLYDLILTIHGAYQRLKNSPKKKTPGPRLIEFAYGIACISDQECDYYLNNWLRAPGIREQSLNQKIIKGFRIWFLSIQRLK